MSHHGKQRPLADIIHNLADFIKEHPPLPEDMTTSQSGINDPFSLIGKETLHKFW